MTIYKLLPFKYNYLKIVFKNKTFFFGRAFKEAYRLRNFSFYIEGIVLIYCWLADFNKFGLFFTISI